VVYPSVRNQPLKSADDQYIGILDDKKREDVTGKIKKRNQA
jgi:hypothetical protein